MDWIGFDQIRQNDISDRLDQIRLDIKIDQMDDWIDRQIYNAF